MSNSTADLIKAIETNPIIDHHAHNLLLPTDIDAHDLLSITSEANGSTLQQGAPSTLAHVRAVHQLSKILQCEASWTAVEAAIKLRRQEPEDAWARQCFQGIETALIDDGLDPSKVHPYDWHSCLTRSPCKRIVRIERVVENIMTEGFEDFSNKSIKEPSAFTHHVLRRFTNAIEKAIADPEVAGFKSVICYRTGLAIPKFNADDKQVLSSYFSNKNVQIFSRLEDERLGPYFVHLTAKLMEDSRSKKPLQFHTGLGDNDIDLGSSNPSHLQDFIKTYTQLPIVLLHASYPFTTEAGYLASVYGNVWLDIGEVFPFLSQDGQERVIREALDLCPTEKLMWSTDGHWFPETYLLALMQFREAIRTVLCDYVDRGALTPLEAIKVVQDIFFRTSNRLYDLGLTLIPLELKDLQVAPPIAADDDWSVGFTELRSFLRKNPSVRYLRLQWLDYTATLRVRVLPMHQALKMFSDKKSIDITQAVFGLLQNDTPCPRVVATGIMNLHPIFQSLRLGSRTGYATMQCEFQSEDGSEVSICSRTVLRKQIERASAHGISFQIGFEIEIVFMSIDVVDGDFRYGSKPVNNGGHAWSTTNALQSDRILELFEDIHAKLEIAGIELQQFHPESCPGQYEFILGPQSPLEAVDTLLAAREIICSTAANANLRATLYPKPFPSNPGSGAHVHISITPVHTWKSFIAGLLKHLKAIAAFTYCNDASYERVVDGGWAGSTWIAWGSQNRETPIRRVKDSHFEIKCIDGLSNPYFVVAAIIGSGVQGVLDKEPLLMKDCLVDPSSLSSEERKDHGIFLQFSKSIEESLQCLGEDEVLCDLLGVQAVDLYVNVKKTERRMLKEMAPEKRRNWLIERY